MSDDLHDIIAASIACESERAPKAFRKLVAYARQFPDPSTSILRDQWDVPKLKAFTRALLNMHNYENHAQEWIEMANTAALYCEEAIELMAAKKETTPDLARFYLWHADFKLHWVYFVQNTDPDQDAKADLAHHQKLLHEAWQTTKIAISLGDTPEFKHQLARLSASTGAYTFARNARRIMTFAALHNDPQFLHSGHFLLADAREILANEQLYNTSAYRDTRETADQITDMYERSNLTPNL